MIRDDARSRHHRLRQCPSGRGAAPPALRQRRRGPAFPNLRALLLATLASACAAGPARIQIPDRPELPPDAVRLVWAGGAASGFFRPDGRPCGRPPAEPTRGLVGWQARRDELACLHDTLDDGPAPASLEFRFRAAILADGSYDLLARGLTADTSGRVEARGGAYGEFVAQARVELTARAPSCTATFTQPLSRAEVTGPWNRPASFSGWVILPDLVVEHCRAGEVLEVRLRLVAEANRGRLEVETFGLLASRTEELQEAFALRRRPEPAPEPGRAPSEPAVTTPTR